MAPVNDVLPQNFIPIPASGTILHSRSRSLIGGYFVLHTSRSTSHEGCVFEVDVSARYLKYRHSSSLTRALTGSLVDEYSTVNFIHYLSHPVTLCLTLLESAIRSPFPLLLLESTTPTHIINSIEHFYELAHFISSCYSDSYSFLFEEYSLLLLTSSSILIPLSVSLDK